ncbi:hypothetical protein [Pedobacter duraquae]|nr:hypothetical protein [Pedobacter duraquae]
MEEPKKILTDLVSYIGVFGTGILGTIITTRLLNREVLLTKRIFIQRVAYSSNSATWGKIDVLYNGAPCNNLHLITVEIRNDSNKNIDDVEVVFTVPEFNTFYANSGQYKQDEVFTPLLLSDGYYRYFMDVSERNRTIESLDEGAQIRLRGEIDHVTREKKFHIPVFNKNGIGIFSFLIDNTTNMEPILMVSIVKKDVRLAPYQEEEERKTIQTKWVEIMTCLSLISFAILIATYSPTVKFTVWLMIINLFTSYYLSMAIYRSIIWIKRFLS